MQQGVVRVAGQLVWGPRGWGVQLLLVVGAGAPGGQGWLGGRPAPGRVTLQTGEKGGGKFVQQG